MINILGEMRMIELIKYVRYDLVCILSYNSCESTTDHVSLFIDMSRYNKWVQPSEIISNYAVNCVTLLLCNVSCYELFLNGHRFPPHRLALIDILCLISIISQATVNSL